MASVTKLAYTIAAVKCIDFSPNFQSFQNKNKCISTEHKNTAGIMIHSFRSLSFKHTYIRIPQPSPLTVVCILKKKKSPSIENKFSIIVQSHRMSIPALQQLSNYTASHIIQSRQAPTSFLSRSYNEDKKS